MISVDDTGSKNEHPQHPPDKKNRDDASRDMNDPICSGLRFAEIEHQQW
jgi:hypothetical protein